MHARAHVADIVTLQVLQVIETGLDLSSWLIGEKVYQRVR